MLTRRERQVVALLSRGVRLPEVAKRLGLKSETVDYTRQRAFAKLRIHKRLHLLRWARRHGFDTETAPSAH